MKNMKNHNIQKAAAAAFTSLTYEWKKHGKSNELKPNDDECGGRRGSVRGGLCYSEE